MANPNLNGHYNIVNPALDEPVGDHTDDDQEPVGDHTDDDQEPDSDHTDDNQEPDSDHTDDDQEPVGDHTDDDQEPVGEEPDSDHTDDDQEPVGDHTDDDQEPVGDHTDDDQEPVGDHTDDNQEPDSDHTDDNQEPGGRNEPNRRHFPAELYKAALLGDIQRATACMDKEHLDYGALTATAVTPKGNSILHINVAVPVHVRRVNGKFLEFFLSRNGDLLNFTNNRNETPLHLASFGQLEAVRLLLRGNRNLLTLRNVDQDTALHMAARNKHTSVVQFMMDSPLSLGIINSTNNAAETPLYLRVQSGSEDLVEAIRNGIYQQNGVIPDATETILHDAIIWGNKDMVTKLNYRGTLQSKDANEQTPIHYAAGIDNTVLKAVLEAALLQPESRAAVYIQDKQGRTAAHVAAQMNNVKGLKLLMEYFPDICEITDNQGRNIVHYSAFLGHVEALDYFLSEIQFSDLVNKKDNGNDTQLHLLVKSLEEKHPVRLSSLQRLRSLIPKLSKLQVMSYNGEHKTPGDIASSIKLTESGSAIRKDVVREIRMMAPKGGRVKQWIPPLLEYKKDIEALPQNYVMNDLGNAAGSHMVVAALIATVSFTAGLTVPGGFYPEIKKEDEKEGFYPGIAMLNHSKAFQAFLFTDCFALVSSLTAILCYFLFVVVPVGKRYRQYLFTWGFRATCISIFMLMAAFLSGAYSYFKPSQKIVVVILVLVVPVVAFIFVTFVLSKIVVSIPGNQPRWQNNRLKWQLLHGHVTDTPTILNAASTLPVWLLYAFSSLSIIIVVFIILYLCKVLV